MSQNKAMVKVWCNNCKTEYEAKSDEPSDRRTKCPGCGSTSRFFSVNVVAKALTYPDLEYKGRPEGRRKPFIKGKIGYEPSTKTQRWMWREQVVDRRNGHYKKVVIDTVTGEVIRFCEEPLRKHQGYGSAKKKMH